MCVCVCAHTQHINATSTIVKENQNTLHDRIFQSRRTLIHKHCFKNTLHIWAIYNKHPHMLKKEQGKHGLTKGEAIIN